MGAAPLEQRELNAPNLCAGVQLDDVGQTGGQAAQLDMPEPVGGGDLRLGHITAVGIVDPLGRGHHTLARLPVDFLDVMNEPIHIKVDLRQIEQVGAAAGEPGQGGGAGQPTGVAPHDLDDGNRAGIIYVGIMPHLSAGGGDVFGGGAVAGAVVGAVEIVVDGLGHADDAALIALSLHIPGDFVAGIHGVVAAVIEKVPHVIALEDLQNTAVIGVVSLRICQLVAAGAQHRGRRAAQQLQLAGILLSHVVQLVLQHTLDAVGGAEHPGNAVGVQRGADHAQGAGVDDGGWAAGLRDDTGPSQFTHV